MKNILLLAVTFTAICFFPGCQSSATSADPMVQPLGAETGRVELSLDPGVLSSEEEAPYCTGAGSCRPANRVCCTGAIQTTHTSCRIGKCCRVRGSACAPNNNQCCYPYSCVLELNFTAKCDIGGGC
jgi:hypothetical protein